MKKLLEVLKSMALKMAQEQIRPLVIKELEKNKDKIIADLNKQIDLPFASENQEKIMIEGIWEILEDSVKKAFPKK